MPPRANGRPVACQLLTICLVLYATRRSLATCFTYLQAKPVAFFSQQDSGTLDTVTICSSLTSGIPNNVLSSTSVLKLPANNLTYVHEDLLRRFSQLEQLDVSANQIVSISAFALQQNGRLLNLNLSRNLLRELTKGVFNNSPNLRVLDLSFNRLTAIDRFIFVSLALIESIDLSNNRISLVAPDAFRNSVNLAELFLANNALASLNEAMEQNIPNSLTKLSLAHNPWHCDCRILWLKLLLQRKDVSADNADLRCHSGSVVHSKGKLWTSLLIHAFVCVPSLYYPNSDTRTTLTPLPGSSVVLTCRTHSMLHSNVVWFKDMRSNWTALHDAPATSVTVNGSRLLPKFEARKTSQGNLTTTFTINRVELADSGVYSCWLGNEAGFVLGNYSLKVELPTAGVASTSTAIGDNPFYVIAIVAGLFGLAFVIVSALVCSAYFRKERVRKRKRNAAQTNGNNNANAARTKTNGTSVALRYNQVEQREFLDTAGDPVAAGKLNQTHYSLANGNTVGDESPKFSTFTYQFHSSGANTLPEGSRFLAGFQRPSEFQEPLSYSPNTLRSQQARSVTFRIDVDENCPLHGYTMRRDEAQLSSAANDLPWHEGTSHFCPVHSPLNAPASATIDAKHVAVRNGFSSPLACPVHGESDAMTASANEPRVNL